MSSSILPSSNPDLSISVYRLSIAMAILPAVAVALRFWSQMVVLRTSRKTRLWWDDWTVLAALPFSIALCVMAAYRSTAGLGKHVYEISLDQIVQELELAYIGYIIDAIAISLPKLSALLFYSRVFTSGHDTRMRRVLWAMAGVVIFWLVADIATAVFQCLPVDEAWSLTRLLDGHCIDIGKWFVAEATLSVLIDLVILTIPLPILWKMQLGRTHKVLINLAFILGYCVILASVGRLASVAQFGVALEMDFTFNAIPFMYWVVAEASLSIVGVCLPSIFAMGRQVAKRGPRALFTPSYKFDQESEKFGTVTTITSRGSAFTHKPRQFSNDSRVSNFTHKPRQFSNDSSVSAFTHKPRQLSDDSSAGHSRQGSRDRLLWRKDSVPMVYPPPQAAMGKALPRIPPGQAPSEAFMV